MAIMRYNVENKSGKDDFYAIRIQNQGYLLPGYSFIEDGKLRNVQYIGGCNGNLKGIGALVEGMDVNEAIKRLEGIQCGPRSTSCPDQLARALKEVTNG